MVKGRGSPIDPSTLHRRHALEIQTLNKISTQMEVAPSGLVLRGVVFPKAMPWAGMGRPFRAGVARGLVLFPGWVPGLVWVALKGQTIIAQGSALGIAPPTSTPPQKNPTALKGQPH